MRKGRNRIWNSQQHTLDPKAISHLPQVFPETAKFLVREVMQVRAEWAYIGRKYYGDSQMDVFWSYVVGITSPLFHALGLLGTPHRRGLSLFQLSWISRRSTC